MTEHQLLLAELLKLGAQLEQKRRRHDWTYQQLADEIATKTKRRRDQDCWRRICLGLTPRPQARTLDILASYLGANSNGKRSKVA